MIYEFDELSSLIQEALIKKEEENIRQCDIENFLEEEMNNLSELLLEENFGEKAVLKDVYYSLSYCQGDGAMIEFDLNLYAVLDGYQECVTLVTKLNRAIQKNNENIRDRNGLHAYSRKDGRGDGDRCGGADALAFKKRR